jgi:hypothetical protein
MRPEEKWTRNPKDPNQKKKRAYRPKSKRVAAKKGQDDDSKSDAPDQASEGSSPADAATEVEVDVEDGRQGHTTGMVEPEVLHLHGRATSAEATMSARQDALSHRPSAGLETRVFQSSPVLNEASHSHPAEADLTPKPLRRQLFPSPLKENQPNSQAASAKKNAVKPLAELPNFCRRSPRLNRSMDVINTHPKTFDATQKENHESASGYNDSLDDLFEDNEDEFQQPPQTPSPSRRSDRLLLRTPGKTPSGGNPRTPGVNKSPSADGALQEARTPKRDFIMGSNRTVEEMTPCTRLMHNEILKDHARRNESNTAAPTEIPENPPAQQADFDFPDLPELDDLSRNFGSMEHIDLNGFNAGFTDMFGTNVRGTNSSPPNGYYNYQNSDFLNQNSTGGQDQWNGAGGMNAQTGSQNNSLTTEETSGLRRSPRRNRSGPGGQM